MHWNTSLADEEMEWSVREKYYIYAHIHIKLFLVDCIATVRSKISVGETIGGNQIDN